MARRAPRAGLVAALAVAALSLRAPDVVSGAPDAPAAPNQWVTDQASFLSEAARLALEQRLAQYASDSGHQVLLWIGRTTGGEPIETWAARAFSAWRVGRKGLDDGVVLFVMADDRKLRIEVGYGLEEQLPDARASRILRDAVAPRLGAGDRDGAARAGVEGIVAALGTPPPSGDEAAGRRPQLGWGTMLLLALAGIGLVAFMITHPGMALLLLTTLASDRGRGRRSGGGGFGGGGWPSGGGGFSGGGGRSGGGGATGSW